MATADDPAPELDLGYKGHPFRFIADKSFFHESFRTDFKHKTDAEWLWAYFVARRAIDPSHQILVSASSIVDRLGEEFRSYPGIPSQVLLVLKGLCRVYPIPREVDLKLAPLYVAKALYDAGMIPLVVSSVGEDKWAERCKRAGVQMKIEGFEKDMSQKRLTENAWFVPLDMHNASHILEDLDPAYPRVVKIVGGPTR